MKKTMRHRSGRLRAKQNFSRLHPPTKSGGLRRRRKISFDSDIRPNTLLGQHFLRSEKTIHAIMHAADIKNTDTILEVGSGEGILTKSLILQAKKVIAVEKDPRLAAHLRQIFAQAKNLEIVEGDILTIDRARLKLRASRYKIVANLPYYLTSYFLRRYLETPPRPTTMTLMIQKEVASRIIARPPHMNLLALSVQSFGAPRVITSVSRALFYPKPNVDSAVIHIADIGTDFFTRHALAPQKFFSIAKKAFSQKRKMLRSSLGIDSSQRPQELSLDDWARIVRALDTH